LAASAVDAALQHVEPDARRERLAGRDHAALRQNDGAGREGLFEWFIHASLRMELGRRGSAGLVSAARAVYYSRL
jgi:hypothetical protein